MSHELAGKVAIITGAARGIGAETARAFVREGASVVIADLLDEAGHALANELGASASYCHTDVTNKDQLKAVVDHAVRQFGRLDIMYNNAGVSGEGAGTFLEADLADFQQTINVDLLGPLLGARIAGEYMASHGGGCILTTASTAGCYGGYGIMPYRAAKGAVIAVTESLAIELGPHNIRVNCISPGPVKTDILAFDSADNAEQMVAAQEVSMKIMMEEQALKRMGLPADIANAAVFLCSDRAAQITGHNLVVDGGMSAGSKTNVMQKMLDAFAQMQES